MSRQPVGRRHGPLEVAIVKGVIEIVELFRVRVHVIQQILGPPVLNFRVGRVGFVCGRFFSCRHFAYRWLGRFRFALLLGCSLFFFSATDEADGEADKQ